MLLLSLFTFRDREQDCRDEQREMVTPALGRQGIDAVAGHRVAARERRSGVKEARAWENGGGRGPRDDADGKD